MDSKYWTKNCHVAKNEASMETQEGLLKSGLTVKQLPFELAASVHTVSF